MIDREDVKDISQGLMQMMSFCETRRYMLIYTWRHLFVQQEGKGSRRAATCSVLLRFNLA